MNRDLRGERTVVSRRTALGIGSAALAEPVLIIKAAWGGKNLHTDFRSLSAGPYELSSFQREHYPKQTGNGIPKDFER